MAERMFGVGLLVMAPVDEEARAMGAHYRRVTIDGKHVLTVESEDAQTTEAEIQIFTEFIVRACNAHEALVEALKLCVSWMPDAEVRVWPPGFRLREEALEKSRAALALAEGK